MSDDDLDLNALNDDELVEQMGDDLYDGLKEEIEESTRILLDRGWTPYDVLTKSLVAGMTVVGEDFRDGILYVPEVLMAANAMKAGMTILKPLLAETGAPRIGSMVIGLLQLSLLGMMIGVQDSSVGLIAVLRVLLTMLFIPATVMLFLASSLCLVLVVFRWSDQEMSHKVGLANLCVAAVLLCIYSAFFVVTQILNV